MAKDKGGAAYDATIGQRFVNALEDLFIWKFAAGPGVSPFEPRGLAEFIPKLAFPDGKTRERFESFFEGAAIRMNRDLHNMPLDNGPMLDWAKVHGREAFKRLSGIELPAEPRETVTVLEALDKMPKVPHRNNFETFLAGDTLTPEEKIKYINGLGQKRMAMETLRGALILGDSVRDAVLKGILKPPADAPFSSQKLLDVAKQAEQLIADLLNPNSPRRQHFREHMEDAIVAMDDPDAQGLLRRRP